MFHRGLKRLGIDQGDQQANGVPDAAMADEPVHRGKHGHGDASGEPALDPRRDRIDLNGEQRPMRLRKGLDPLYFQPISTQLIRIRQENKAAEADVSSSQSEARKTEVEVALKAHEMYYALLVAQLNRQAAG